MGHPARLILRPVAAKLTKSKDWFTKMDPYLIIQVGNQKQRTKTHKNGGKNPSWQDSFAFELTGHEAMLNVMCYDKDVFTSDDFIAQCSINMEIFFHKKKGQQWFRMIRKGGKDGGQLLLDWEYKMVKMPGYNVPQTNVMAHNQTYQQQPQYRAPQQPLAYPPRAQPQPQANPYLNQAANYMYQQRNFNQPPPPQQQMPTSYGAPPGMPNLGGFQGNYPLNAFANGINGALTPPPPPAYMRGQTGPNGVYGNYPPGY